MNTDTFHLIFYCDGSSRPNGQYGGYGLFGYSWRANRLPKNTKHPCKAALTFTNKGISKEKADTPIEVLDIFEVIEAVDLPATTNNQVELMAILRALEIGQTLPGVASILLLTDSNYVVSGYNDNLLKWVNSGWKRQDGRPLAHIEEWRQLDGFRRELSVLGVDLQIKWVKGHDGDYGNEMSDVFSDIGSNAARVQMTTQDKPFNSHVLHTRQTYAEYKASYGEKDFVYHFKDLFFSTASTQDTNFCFICNTEDEREMGKRNNASVFVATTGYTPDFVKSVRAFYRGLPRRYTAPCSVKFSNFTDRDKLRLTSLAPVEYLLRPISGSERNAYSLVGEDTPFVLENTVEFPFVSNVTMLMNRLQDIEENFDQEHYIIHSVTERFVSDGKLVIDNRVKFVDFSDLDMQGKVFKQKLLVAVGYDLPNYLVMKNLEAVITDISLMFHREQGCNFYTLYTKITTDDRVILCVNVPNKYLVLSF